MSWSTLSEDVWKHILVHVPLKHRLLSCSRVNQTLHRAAAAATQQVKLYQIEAGVQRLPGLCQWMLQHGQHLTSLWLCVPDKALTELPCPNLRELDLRDMQVQLSASSTQPGVLHSCTRLTKLSLFRCPLTDRHSSPSALSALVELQHLELHVGAVVSGSTDDGGMPCAVLQHLTKLTHLSLSQAGQLLHVDSLQHTSLANLQVLDISNSTIPLSPSTTPILSGATALRKVCLFSVDLDPSILHDCTQLQDLELDHLAIISAGGAAALHSLLGRLQQLQSLKLCKLECDWPAAAAAYSSLTASSALQKLHLTLDDMPAGVWPHVFPVSRQLPALQQLVMYWSDWDDPDPPPAAALATDDISCPTSCCPGLCSIDISLQPDTELSDLAKASGLTNLWVSGLQTGGFESLRALSGLVSLQELSVHLGGPITPQDLLRLTALKGLTRLCVDPGDEPEFECADDVAMDLTQVCTYKHGFMSVYHHKPLQHRDSTCCLHVGGPSCSCPYCRPIKLNFHAYSSITAMLCGHL